MKIGIIGCGWAFDIYMASWAEGRGLEIAGVWDIDPARLDVVCRHYGLRRYETNAALLADAGVAIVVNLTPPPSHYRVTKSALEAGKHVYSESLSPPTWSRRASFSPSPRPTVCIFAARRRTFWAIRHRPCGKRSRTAPSAMSASSMRSWTAVPSACSGPRLGVRKPAPRFPGPTSSRWAALGSTPGITSPSCARCSAR